MAIQPIDLQTLFTQMDKVAKTQVQEKAALTIKQELQTAAYQRKAEMKVRSVNRTQGQGDGVEHLKERERPHEEEQENRKRERDNEADEEAQTPAPEQVRDPDLGRNIDLSG